MKVNYSFINQYIEIKEERLNEYTEGLVKELRRTNLIVEFTKSLRYFMPKYNELKHFNAEKIVGKFFHNAGIKLN